VKVLVAWANRHGATRGVAQHIAEALARNGLDVTLAHADAAERLGQYGAFVVGGATHMHHWLNEAASFVRHHQMLLSDRPVWLYSVEPGRTDVGGSRGRDAREACAPREFREFAATIRPRDARVFFARCDPDSAVGGVAAGLLARIARTDPVVVSVAAHDELSDWTAIDAWAVGIARALGAGCGAGEGPARSGGSIGVSPRPCDSLAAAITRGASKQTYYTIRWLVDRPRRNDAFRAYAYFRWVDDVLDAEAPPGSVWGEAERLICKRFLDRQKFVLERGLLGEPPRDASRQEAMLLDLVRNVDRSGTGVESYLRHMMRVMDFDVRRRGRPVSEGELNNYTQWLAIAVTEAMHHFIGNGAGAPSDPTRYMAVSGAHILHMLRDTYVDLRAGYWNIPGELLERHSIGPEDVHSDAYRAWVEARVRLASKYLEQGKAYLARVENMRHRVAGLAYVARFEWLIEALERDEFRLRPDYATGGRVATGLHRSWRLLSLIRGAALPAATAKTAGAWVGRR
jgi:menaquinone-dependent protoporphyrinogen oxidase